MSADASAQCDRAERIIRNAWQDLPAYDRCLLETIGASQWTIATAPLGSVIHDLLRSAGYARLDGHAVRDLDLAVGVWISQLRLVVINAQHPALADLDTNTYEAMLARVAWHEWAHALSVVRATRGDILAGEDLLQLAPAGVREFVRRGGYRRSEYAHELVAEIYALVRRVSGWSE
ncbi:MAG: hypothetical protein QOI48_3035 [Solirubrobacteraceae bacterium]|nr:hypothetical protein [Solirubrobacteraceae bacterium]